MLGGTASASRSRFLLRHQALSGMTRIQSGGHDRSVEILANWNALRHRFASAQRAGLPDEIEIAGLVGSLEERVLGRKGIAPLMSAAGAVVWHAGGASGLIARP